MHKPMEEDPRLNTLPEQEMQAKPTYQQLETRVAALEEYVSTLNHEIELLREFPTEGERTALQSRVRELTAMIRKDATERERQLLHQLEAEHKRNDHIMKKHVARANGLMARVREGERLHKVYQELCERADMPKPPCPHGRQASQCLNCVAAWLGREGAMPEASRHRKTAKGDR